jgi:hypothetical protein
LEFAFLADKNFIIRAICSYTLQGCCMSFFEEINSDLGIFGEHDDICITIVPSRGAIVQGHKKLLKITETSLVVAGKNKRVIEISGKNIEIFSLAASEIVVHGKIDWVGEKYD